MVGLLLELLASSVFNLLGYFLWRRTCPQCHGRLKYLPRGAGGERVQCLRCERVWLRGKGWHLRPAAPEGG